MLSARDKFFYTRTLCCLLKSLEGVKTEIELSNECHVSGTIETVSASMGVTLANCDVIVNQTWKRLQHVYVSGRKIRMVVIPDNMDMIQLMQNVIDMFSRKVSTGDEFRTKGKRINLKNFGRKTVDEGREMCSMHTLDKTNKTRIDNENKDTELRK